MSMNMLRPMWLKQISKITSNVKKFIIQRTVTFSATSFAEAKTQRTTVDPEDVERHTKLLKDWWDPHGPMKALHAYNLIRVPFIRDGLLDSNALEYSKYPLKDKKILDVGCGGGILSEPLARLGANVTGIDASKELVELAKQHSPFPTTQYLYTTIEEHAESHERAYDGVVASEIIEHVSDQTLFVQSCAKVLKPGGHIFFTTPNRTTAARIGVIFLAEYVFRMVPVGTHQIENFTTPTELSFMLERNGCHVELTHGIMYNILTNQWSWSRIDAFAFALQAVKTGESSKKK